MDRFHKCVTLLIVIAIPLWFVPVIYHDLTHPEVWDSDWLHDPRLYLPILGGVAVIYVVLGLHGWCVRRRDRQGQGSQALGKGRGRKR